MAQSPGSPPGSAPNKITTILADQPIGEVRGKQVFGLMPFLQLMQRIVAFLGNPADTGSPGSTLSQTVGSLTSIATFAGFGPGTEGPRQSDVDARYFGFPPPPAADQCCNRFGPVGGLLPFSQTGTGGGSGPVTLVLQTEDLQPIQTETGAFITL